MAGRPEFGFFPIEVLPGVKGIPDTTELASPHWVYAEKVRSTGETLRKLGGWESYTFNNGNTISGVPRSGYNIQIGNNIWILIGTNTRLYSLVGSLLTNITPVDTSSVAAADSLDTYYKTLANNPATTVLGSATIMIEDTATKVRGGDIIELSGFSGALNGIPDTELNAVHIARTQATDSFTIRVGTSATSSSAGGGASVVLATAIITLNDAAHGLGEGDRIFVDDAAATGGIPDTEINVEHIIRNVTTDAFDFVAVTVATSSVTGGGGASTIYYPPIPAGEADASSGIGYGMGLYGAGQYGVSKTSTASVLQPRVWTHDRFGNNPLMSPGQQTGLYQWLGSNLVAPTLVTNAPTAINGFFTSNNIVVTYGSGNVKNRLKWSDQGNQTVWTATPQNQAGEDDIEGANGFIAHATVRGELNLLWTPTQLYTMRYIGAPLVWDVKQVDDAEGIISQNAVAVHGGVAVWMGNDNIFVYAGGVVSVVPSNSGKQCTLLRYVFDDLNYTQKAKIFAWHNRKFNEIWIHYPSGNSMEIDRMIRVSLDDYVWWPDVMDRTMAVQQYLQQFPVLASSDGTLYRHETGMNADGQAMRMVLRSKYFQRASSHTQIGNIIPDSIQTGDLQMTVRSKEWPQGTAVQEVDRTIEPTTPYVGMLVDARNWQYELVHEVLDGDWVGGAWIEDINKGEPR